LSSNPWVDITAATGVYRRDPVSVRVGRPNWHGRADPAQGRLTADNRTGDWSPDNPIGPYHGQLTRNLPTRMGVLSEGDAWVEWTESADGKDVMSTPHAAGHDITGDIDIRIEIGPTYDPIPLASGGSWHRLASRAGGSAGWRLMMSDHDGGLDLVLQWWESGGTAFSAFYVDAAGDWLPRSVLWSRTGIRVTLDVSTAVVEWFLADSIDGSWTSMGSFVESAGSTNIGSGSNAIRLGGVDGVSTIDGFRGQIYAFQLRDGIDGTVEADLDLADATPGAASVVDDEGLTWTVGSEGRISDTLWRLTGEVGSWPVRWTIPADSDQWVPLVVAGPLRRLRQGQGTLYSALRRGIIREQLSTAVVGYWPMEETGDQHLRRMGPAIGTKTLVRYGGTPNPASNTDFLASAPIPTLNDDIWQTFVDPYPSTDQWMVRLLFSAPSDASAGVDVDFLEVRTTDLTYLVRYSSASEGGLRVLAYRTGVLVHDTSYVAFNINGRPVRMSLTVEKVGGNVAVFLETIDVGAALPGGVSFTIGSAKAGRVTLVRFNKNRDGEKLAVGHLTVESVARDGDLIDDLDAWDGETAAARVRRLCLEEGVTYRIQGEYDDSARMGPQSVATLADLLQQCADTDLGILYDAPDRAAIAYRTGASIRNQPGITLDYSAGEIAGVPELDRDDSGFANDVTITNWDSSEYRAVVRTGPNSVLPPPSGTGRYDTTYPVSLDDGDALADHANTRLALHSVDTARISRLRIDLALPAITPTLRAEILAMRPGDRIAVEGLPSLIHPYALPQIVQGWTETIIPPFEHYIDVVTTPAAPWDTGVIEPASTEVVARYDTAGSELAAGVAQSATSMSVATTFGPLWTTASGDLPFDVLADGIRVTVTAISGTSSPQTFTITGATVLRALAAGGDVRLADSTVYSL
jgi:hypothetical protein